MSHPNSGDKTLSSMFTGVPAPGNLLDSYVQLVIMLLASRDSEEVLSGAVELVRQIEALAPESLATQHFCKALNAQVYREAAR
ncbi:MAG TPA: hypothetical protein VHY91_14545 [Pirellulales bacterium]|jgi:hypothetical protein|nr:hypothetical protein [Pirellulales bacterium]